VLPTPQIPIAPISFVAILLFKKKIILGFCNDKRRLRKFKNSLCFSPQKKSTSRGTPEYHRSLPISLCWERIIDFFIKLIVQIFENTCRHAENVKQNSQARYSFHYLV
jgi:hypothetical protein